MTLTDIVIQNTKDIQQLKAEQMGEDNLIVSALYFTEIGSISDILTGKSRTQGDGSFILGHPTLGILGTSKLGSGGASSFISGSYSVV